MKKIKVFFINMIMMTITSLMLSGAGIIFRVFLTNRLGASVTGLYQLIMSVFMLFVTFAQSGIRLATTRLVAEELGIGNAGGVKKVILRCLWYCLCFGITACLILLFSADFIAINWLKERSAVVPLHILAICLPFIPLTSALSGYFTAVRRVAKSSLVQIADQFLTIFLTLLLLSLIPETSPELTCSAIVVGMTSSEMLSCLILFFLYKRDLSNYSNRSSNSKGLTFRLLKIALPIALSSYLRSGLSTIEQLLIPGGLRKSGQNHEAALATYGVIHGMIMPILLFPFSLLTASAELLIPELAESEVQRKNKRITYIVTRALRFTIYYSIGISALLFFYASLLGNAIYKSADASHYIRLIAPLVPIMYLDNTVDAVLKGLGYQLTSMKINILDSALSIILVLTLLPRWGVLGYLITIYATEGFNFVLSFIKLISITKFNLRLFSDIITPCFCSIFAILCTITLLPTQNLILQIFVSALAYFILLKITSVLTKDDVLWAKSIFKP